MENKEILDKIIQGTQKEEQVNIPFNGEDYTFTLRPLTSGELSKIQKIERKGLSIDIGSKGAKPSMINLGDFTDNQNLAMVEAISISLDAPSDKVKQLPIELVESLFNEVARISNISDKELISLKNFH